MRFTTHFNDFSQSRPSSIRAPLPTQVDHGRTAQSREEQWKALALQRWENEGGRTAESSWFGARIEFNPARFFGPMNPASGR